MTLRTNLRALYRDEKVAKLITAVLMLVIAYNGMHNLLALINVMLVAMAVHLIFEVGDERASDSDGGSR